MPSKLKSTKLKKKTKAKRPEFDRTGEMPEGSTPAPETVPPRPSSGLAAVDLTAPVAVQSSGHRYEEYTLGDEDPAVNKEKSGITEPPPAAAEDRQDADTPADEVKAVKVTKVRRKKVKPKDK